MGSVKQRREQSRGRFRERWRKFIYPYGPYGTKRMFSPRQWERRDRILVIGELLAVLAALAAIPVELSDWEHGAWLVIAATIIGTAALLWYAFDLVSTGEPPLTSRMTHRIRSVVQAMEFEEQGMTIDWDGIDQAGNIPMDITTLKNVTAEAKANWKSQGMDRALLSTENFDTVPETAEDQAED